MPKSVYGRWSVGFGVLAIILFFIPIGVIPVPYIRFIVTCFVALGAAITGFVAIRKFGDNSPLVYTSIIVSILVFLFPILFLLGEVLFPHE